MLIKLHDMYLHAIPASLILHVCLKLSSEVHLKRCHFSMYLKGHILSEEIWFLNLFLFFPKQPWDQVHAHSCCLLVALCFRLLRLIWSHILKLHLGHTIFDKHTSFTNNVSGVLDEDPERVLAAPTIFLLQRTFSVASLYPPQQRA